MQRHVLESAFAFTPICSLQFTFKVAKGQNTSVSVCLNHCNSQDSIFLVSTLPQDGALKATSPMETIYVSRNVMTFVCREAEWFSSLLIPSAESVPL